MSFVIPIPTNPILSVQKLSELTAIPVDIGDMTDQDSELYIEKLRGAWDKNGIQEHSHKLFGLRYTDEDYYATLIWDCTLLYRISCSRMRKNTANDHINYIKNHIFPILYWARDNLEGAFSLDERGFTFATAEDQFLFKVRFKGLIV